MTTTNNTTETPTLPLQLCKRCKRYNNPTLFEQATAKQGDNKTTIHKFYGCEFCGWKVTP